ncbi:MAG: hypothetical protein DHS20C10_08450 [marine bacterium B5-7]|nr:MAG: hypothetical protein DHS20C10_08450 [marine bacterium B5-7]
MSVEIEISKAVFNSVETAAMKNHLSIEKQFELWTRVGRSALENTDLPVQFIHDIIRSKYIDCIDGDPASSAG